MDAKKPVRPSPNQPSPTQRAQQAIAKQQTKLAPPAAFGAKVANAIPMPPPPAPPKPDNMQLIPPTAAGQPLANRQAPLGAKPGMKDLFKPPTTANQMFQQGAKMAFDSATLPSTPAKPQPAANPMADFGARMGQFAGSVAAPGIAFGKSLGQAAGLGGKPPAPAPAPTAGAPPAPPAPPAQAPGVPPADDPTGLGGFASATGDMGKLLGHFPGVKEMAEPVMNSAKGMLGAGKAMLQPPPSAPPAGADPAGPPSPQGADPAGEAPPPAAGGGGIADMLGGGDWSKALSSLGSGDFGGAWGNTPGYGKLGLGMGGGMILLMLLKKLFGGGGEKYGHAHVKKARDILDNLSSSQIAKFQGELMAIKISAVKAAPRGSRITRGGKPTTGKFSLGHQFQGSTTKAAIDWGKMLGKAKGIAGKAQGLASHPAVQHGLMPGAGAAGSMGLAGAAGFDDPESLAAAGLGGYAMFSPITKKIIDSKSMEKFKNVPISDTQKQWAGRLTGYPAMLAGKGALVAAPAMARGMADSVKNVQDTTGNLSKFTGEMTQPAGGWYLPEGSAEWQFVPQAKMPEFQAKADGGQGTFEPKPSPGTELAKGITGLGELGTAAGSAGKAMVEPLQSAAKSVENAAASGEAASNNIQGLSGTLQNALPDAAREGARELGSQFSGFNDLAGTLSKIAPWAIGGGLGVGGLYALSRLLKARKRPEEERRQLMLRKYGADMAEKQSVMAIPLLGGMIGAANSKNKARGAGVGMLTGLGGEVGMAAGLGLGALAHSQGHNPWAAYPLGGLGGAALGGLGSYYAADRMLPHKRARKEEPDKADGVKETADEALADKVAAALAMTPAQRLARAQRVSRLRLKNNRASFEEETPPVGNAAQQYGKAAAMLKTISGVGKTTSTNDTAKARDSRGARPVTV